MLEPENKEKKQEPNEESSIQEEITASFKEQLNSLFQRSKENIKKAVTAIIGSVFIFLFAKIKGIEKLHIKMSFDVDSFAEQIDERFDHVNLDENEMSTQEIADRNVTFVKIKLNNKEIKYAFCLIPAVIQSIFLYKKQGEAAKTRIDTFPSSGFTHKLEEGLFADIAYEKIKNNIMISEIKFEHHINDTKKTTHIVKNEEATHIVKHEKEVDHGPNSLQGAASLSETKQLDKQENLN